MLALLRFFLDQSLGQEHESQKLGPFGHNVSHDLSPLSFGIRAQVEKRPAGSGEREKHGQGVVSNSLDHATPEAATRLPALRRPDLIEILGRDHRHDYARPVRYGIAKKRAQMRLRVALEIEGNP